jgi:hypothetical protein
MEPNTHARTTAEYAITWQAIVEDHLSDELVDSLRRLTWASWGVGMAEREIGVALAHHLAHALRVAASPSGGVQPSVDYLRWAAGDRGATAELR